MPRKTNKKRDSGEAAIKVRGREAKIFEQLPVRAFFRLRLILTLQLGTAGKRFDIFQHFRAGGVECRQTLARLSKPGEKAAREDTQHLNPGGKRQRLVEKNRRKTGKMPAFRPSPEFTKYCYTLPLRIS